MYLLSPLVGSTYTTIRRAKPFGSIKPVREKFSAQSKLQSYEHRAGGVQSRVL